MKIKVLKNIVWDKTVEWIKDNEWAQTHEIPHHIKTKKKDVETVAKKTKESWSKDALWSCIEDANPSFNEVTVDANYFIEQTLIPQFMSGMPPDIVQQYHTENWSAGVQDSSRTLAAVDACSCLLSVPSLP